MTDPRPASSPPFRLDRPRLRRRLAGSWKVAVLSAPAGWGKTTLALQIASSRRALICRLSSEDRDPARLLGTLIGAGLAAKPPVGERTARLFGARREFERDGGLLTASLLAEWVPARGRRLVVVDDLHVLARAASALAWLRRVIEESDPRLRFLLTCRGEPPLPLARLELAGGLIRLGTDDLRFTTDEQSRLLARGFGVRLERHHEEQLRESVRGFAAGLVLAARHLRGTGRTPSALAPPGAALDPADAARRFLDEEVLALLPARLRQALVLSAPLESLDARDLGLVLGAARADELRAEARRRDLFVESVGAESLRFHPLFRSLLLERFDRDVSARERRRIVTRLARAWTRCGETSRAVRLLAERGELDAAETMFHRAAAGRVPGVAPEALGALAVELHARLREGRREIYSPWLLFHGAAQASGARDFAEALRLGREALRRFVATADWNGAARTFRFLGRAAIATGRPAAELKRNLPLVRRAPAASREARVVIACAEGEMRLYAGEPTAARAALDRASADARRVPVALKAELEIMRATVGYTQGDWTHYVATVSRWLPAIRHSGDAGRVQALLLGLAEARIYLGEEERVFGYLDELRALTPWVSGLSLPTFEAELRARAWSESGRWSEAEGAFRDARARAKAEGSPVSELRVDVWEGIFERRRGRLARAAARLERAERGFAAMEARAWLALARMEHGLVRGLRGDASGALHALADAARISREHRDGRELARNALFEAAVRRRSGERFGVPFARALRALDRERYLVLLRKEAEIVVPLLADDRDLPAPLWERAVASLPAALRARIGGRRGSREGSSPRTALGAGARAPGGPSARGEERIRIRLLGGFEVQRHGVTVPFARRAAERLVAQLALRLGEPIAREALAEALWPEAAPDASRNRFDVTLHAARRGLEPDAGPRGPWRVLRIDAGLCRLDPARVEVDVAAFEAAAEACETLVRRLVDATRASGAPARSVSAAERIALDRALSLERGELLPGWTDTAWAEGERERLRTRAARLRLAEGLAALAGHDPAAAHDTACRLLERDALHEEAHRLELAALVQLGERTRAEQRHRAFVAKLARELDVPPSPETVALARELLGEAAFNRA
ncbi:MAG: BTAD domain-containing putative transcriptional regulator [bacterium]